MQDEVLVCVADLDSNSPVFGADLLYHKLCLASYLRKFDRLQSSSNKTRKGLQKNCVFLEEADSIRQALDHGFGLPLSEIRDTINNKHEEDIIST